MVNLPIYNCYRLNYNQVVYFAHIYFGKLLRLQDITGWLNNSSYLFEYSYVEMNSELTQEGVQSFYDCKLEFLRLMILYLIQQKRLPDGPYLVVDDRIV